MQIMFLFKAKFTKKKLIFTLTECTLVTFLNINQTCKLPAGIR